MNALDEFADDPSGQASRDIPEPDQDGWNIVRNNPRRRKRSTQKNGNVNTADTSEDVIVNQIASKDIQVVKCEKNVGKIYWYVPFKVTVKESDRDKLLNPGIWPCNIFVRKFREPRPRSDMFRQADSL